MSAQRTFSVTYQKGILPVDVTVSPGSSLGDSTTISGTTIAGAKVQLSVSGPVNYSRTVTGKSFSFKVETGAEGKYNIVLTVTKKGLEGRTFTASSVRAPRRFLASCGPSRARTRRGSPFPGIRRICRPLHGTASSCAT